MTVYINCRDHQKIHPQTLASIQNQTLLCDVEIIESQSCPTRLSLLKNCNSEITFFMDEDVVLPDPHFLSNLCGLFNQRPDIQFFAARYDSDPKANYLQKAYNWLTNLWSQTTSEDTSLSPSLNAPGGFWAVRTNVHELCQEWTEPLEWGGEDTQALRFLQSKGLTTFSSDQLKVLHYPQARLLWFAKRAFKQGQAKRKYDFKTAIHPASTVTNIAKNLHYLPALLFHQSFVTLGFVYEFAKSSMANTSPQRPEIK